MKTKDERLACLSERLDNLSKKAAQASLEAKEARELRQEAIQEKISSAKGNIAAMEENIRLSGERGMSRFSSQLIKIQMKLEARKDAVDKKLLERYINGRIAHILDLYDSIDYLISDAKLSLLELLEAMEEYENRFGEGDFEFPETTDEEA